jgi:hypothetical protein
MKEYMMGCPKMEYLLIINQTWLAKFAFGSIICPAINFQLEDFLS